jgi:hypothetical protein
LKASTVHRNVNERAHMGVLGDDVCRQEQALEQGMVRPFLYLVSMRPSKRNRVANEVL